MTSDVGDKEQVKKRKSKAQLEQERQDEDLRKVLETYEGRSFIWWLLENAGIYRTTFSVEPNEAAFNEGIRQIGLLTLSRVDEVAPNAYTKIRAEAQARKENT
ncbi:MAG TPA: hypothetical protein VKA31_11385 [Mariprofundaceae bacterium]|nr:hypothetical protein [Mariprofundaceae bacterium]